MSWWSASGFMEKAACEAWRTEGLVLGGYTVEMITEGRESLELMGKGKCVFLHPNPEVIIPVAISGSALSGV